jgi:hypothetical protein
MIFEQIDLRAGGWLAPIVFTIIQTVRDFRQYFIGHGKKPRYTRVAQTIADEAATLLAFDKAALAKAAQVV